MDHLALFPLLLCLYGISPVTADNEIIFDDSNGLGRVFDGIGGLSGGGATSKLLVNYPDQQRNEVLDYLFKPNFGASLQILKVEIGGDIQSTDGTEASHMHNSWDENYERGYEWWLMLEAKKRNPDIKLYGLPWGFPGWIGQGTQSPYKNVNITADYVVRWINGARTHYNLTIDYVGIWNERNYDINYIKTLRKQLDQRGLKHVMIVAADEKWEISADIKKDPELASIVQAIGCHYPGTLSTDEAQQTGKPLWASEDYSTFNDEVGGGCWARILNQNYVNGLMTSTISWNLIGSYYQGLPYFRDGLMTAIEPWSGNYVVETPIWLSAHTTQFTSIGWKYLAHKNGVGHLPNGGSYVGLVSPKGDQLSIIIETMTHDHSKCIRPNLPPYTVKPQNITITLKGSFAKLTQLYVRYSKLSFNQNPDIMFEAKEPVKVLGGKVQLSLDLDEVYTLSTISKSQKGSYKTPPPSAPFPLPYKDNFDTYKLFQEPFLLAPQAGSLEVVKCENVSHGLIVRQPVLHHPVKWCPIPLISPYAVVGNYSWEDVFIEIDYRYPPVNSTDGIFVAARVDQGGCQAFGAHGIYLFVLSNKQFQLSNDLVRTKIIHTGTLPSQTAGWHKMSLLVQGNLAMGAIDGAGIFNITVPTTPANGFAAIGTDTYGLADFDNLHLANQTDGLAIMKEYFKKSFSRHPKSLYFVKEHH